MADMDMDMEFSGRRASAHGVSLSPRDIADALRLLNLLIAANGAAPSEGATRQQAKERTSGDSQGRELETARAILARRRLRARHFAQSMFGEPAWDILLALYVSDLGGSRNTISRLADMSGAPMTTALRWLDYLEQAKLVRRHQSPTDRRVMFVELTDLGREKLGDYVREVHTGALFA